MPKHVFYVVSIISCAALAVALGGGCGGGSETDPVGTVKLQVQWPERAEIDSRLIPELSDFIEVEIRDVATGAVRVSDMLERPQEPPLVTEVTYENILISANAHLRATAYPVDPTEDPAAVAQASGSMRIVIPPGGIAYPHDGSPGDSINLVMDSTVHSVTIMAETDSAENGGALQLDVGETLQLAATAYDVDGNMVLVPDFDWSSSHSSVTVDQEGLVTAEEAGESEITATEVTSGVSGSVTVEGVADEDDETPSCVFRERDDAMHSPTGSVPVGAKAYTADRYAMEIEPGRHGRIGIFDRETDELLVEIAALPEGETNPLKGLAWSPNGEDIAVLYHGGSRRGATIYDTGTGQIHLRLPFGSFYHYMVYSTCGQRLCFSHQGTEVDEIIHIVADEVPITISDYEGEQ